MAIGNVLQSCDRGRGSIFTNFNVELEMDFPYSHAQNNV